MTVGMAILLELFPLTLGNQRYAKAVVISAAFTYAVMFVWGPWAAIAAQAAGSLVLDLRARKLTSYVTRSPRDFAQDVCLSLGVYAMAPIVVDVALDNWFLTPLLVTPMLLLYHTGRIAESREHAAGHDPLTGLANRITFTAAVETALTSQSRSDEQFAVMLIDLDDFKGINDTLGHHAGDGVLIEFAERLRRSVRADDCVARLGGDEFALVVRRVDETGAAAVADQIRLLAADPVTVEAADVPIGFSLGVALCPQHGGSAATLLRAADTAMYCAKQRRSGVEVYATATGGQAMFERLPPV